jgi:hypothetical protein
MTFTPEQLEQVAAKQRGDAIRSSDWNIVVDEVQEVGEQTQNLNNTKVNRSGDTITGSLNVEGDLRIGTNSRSVSAVNGTLNANSVTMAGTTWTELDSGEVVGDVFPLSGRVSGIRDDQGNLRENLIIGGNGNITFLPGRGVASGTGEEIIMRWDGNVGIGAVQPVNRLHVRSNTPTRGLISNSVTTLIENTNQTGGGCLALKVGRNTNSSGMFDRNVLFMAFLSANNGFFGDISANGNSITFRGLSADYAEWLPRLQEDEVIEPGDIIGVFGGKITKVTDNAHQVMAITDRPIVLGNMPDKKQEHLYEQVSFIGQIPIKVRGSVQAGDFIIPSGLNDGTGIAVAPQDITPIQCSQIVGRAWESSDEVEVKRVNAAVGLDNSSAVATSLMSEMETLKAELQELKREKSLV